MMTGLLGVSGRLFPTQYLAEQLTDDAAGWASLGDVETTRRGFDRWWRMVSGRCGPASGLRELFDLAAVPLASLLGFTAHGVVFQRGHARGVLETPGRTAVALLLLPWADRPVSLWRDVSAAAREVGARWCLVLAPPFLSIVEARGFALRRSVDIELPAVLGSAAFAHLLILARADAFDTPPDRSLARIDGLLVQAGQYRTRVRDDLQSGVARALDAMTAAFTTDPRPADQALTVVYRILFLLFAESRALVPCDDPAYAGAYGVGALCREALQEAPRFSLWESLAATTRLSRVGCRHEDFAVSAFNGPLFARTAAPSLESGRSSPRPRRRGTQARELAAKAALVALGSRAGRSGRESISYTDLGVEQLGAVYERVLDLDPGPTRPGRVAGRRERAASTSSGHSAARKQSGTFYTPQPLAEFVVRRTLAPLVAGRSSDDILTLRVVDPAMGSGAFLVAACRYLARAYARALVEEGRAAPSDFDGPERAAVRRLVAERCLAGVDRNPVAVQLARLSLWLTTLARGKPLGFLDHRLRVGDSLIGATPEDLLRVHGRGAAINRRAEGRRGEHELPLFAAEAVEHAIRRTVRPLSALIARRDETVSDVRAKEVLWRQLSGDSGPLSPWRLAATLWCARWFWPASSSALSPAELRALMDAVLNRDRTLGEKHVARRLATARDIGGLGRFFHWPLEFPDVFYDQTAHAPRGGFDAVIGNPPWEMLRRDPSGAPNTDRQQLVRFIRESGLYPSCDRGHVNLYQPFLDRALSIARTGGRVGLILPWGVAVDDGAALLRRRLLKEAAVDTLVGLDNRRGLFPIHRGLRFLVAIASTGRSTGDILARFGVTQATELAALPEQGGMTEAGEACFPVRLTPRQIAVVGGTTLRIPDVRRRDDLDLLEKLAATMPRLGDPASWSARFGRELNATESRSHCGPTGLPIVEGKHVGRFAVKIAPAIRIERSAALRLLPDARFDAPRLAYRDVSGVANSRSLIAGIVPAGVVTTHTVFCLRTAVPLEQQHFLCGVFNSFVLNAVTRLLMGGHVTTGLVENLPVPPWRGDDRDRLIALLAAELAERPEVAETQAVLEAHVARRYSLDEVSFARLLEGFPLVPAEHRVRARESLRRICASGC